MKIFSALILSLVLTAITTNETSAQGAYIKPHCAESGLSLEQHIAKEKATKYNEVYGKLIIADNTMEDKLDRKAEIRCELLSTTSSTERVVLQSEYDTLKAEIKLGIQLLNN